ncbi:MAG: hypothetical protein O7B26_09780, partial [Planctomycetota bacterium]|nr:hypothetical protein [Planctomycetota bacterium]
LPAKPAPAQTQVLKKDVHVFLDVSGTIRNDARKKKNLSEIVNALLEAKDPEFGGRVITERDRVFIYGFSDRVQAFSPESKDGLTLDQIKAAMDQFVGSDKFGDVDTASTLFDTLFDRILELPGIRTSQADRLPIVIIASDFVHDTNNRVCIHRDRPGDRADYADEIERLRERVGRSSDRYKSVIFGYIYVDWKEGEKLPFNPPARPANQKQNDCWKEFVNDLLLLREITVPHFNGFSVSFRNIEESVEPFIEALKEQIRLAAYPLNFNEARIESRDGGFRFAADVDNASESESLIFDLYFFAGGGGRPIRVSPGSGRGKRIDPGLSSIEIDLPEGIGRKLSLEPDLKVSIVDLKTRGTKIDNLTRFDVATRPFSVLGIENPWVDISAGSVVIVATITNIGQRPNAIRSAYVQPTGGGSPTPALLDGDKVIPPGEAPELRFVIPPASVNKIFAGETFWFGIRDEAENTDDPVVSIPSVGRPPLEVRFDGPPSYTAGGTLEIMLRAENKGPRDNLLKAVRIIAPADPSGDPVYETTVGRPVTVGQTVSVRLTVPADRARELAGANLFVDDIRESWERERDPGGPVPVGPVQLPPVALARDPYDLNPERDVLLPKDLGGDGKSGVVRLPVSTIGPGQGRVSFVTFGLAPGQPPIEVALADPILVTGPEQVTEIPMARADLQRLLSSREATVIFRESAGESAPAGTGQTLRIPSERVVRLESVGFETDALGRAVLAETGKMRLLVTVINDRPALPVSPVYLLVASDPEGRKDRMEFPWSELRPDIDSLWDTIARVKVELDFDQAARNRLMERDRLYLWLATGPDPEDLLASYVVPLPKKTPLRPQARSLPLSQADPGFLSIELINDGVMPVRFTGIELPELAEGGGPGPLLGPETPTVVFAGTDEPQSVRLVVTPDMTERLAKRADRKTTVKGILVDETDTNSRGRADAESTQLALVRDRLRIEDVTPQKLAGAKDTLFVKIDGTVRRDSMIGGEGQGTLRNVQDMEIEVRLGLGSDDYIYSGQTQVRVDAVTGAFNLVSKTENFRGNPAIFRIELVSATTNDKSESMPVSDNWFDGIRTNTPKFFVGVALITLLLFLFARFRSGTDLATQVAEGFYREMAMPWARLLLWGSTGSVGSFGVGYGIPHELFPYNFPMHVAFMVALGLTMFTMALTVVVPWSTKAANWWVKRQAGRKGPEPLQIYQSYAYRLFVAAGAFLMVGILYYVNDLLVPLTASPDIPVVEMKLAQPSLTGP